MENPLFNTFIEAGQQVSFLGKIFVLIYTFKAGYPYTADMNGFQQEGVGPMDMTIDWESGKRWNTANAYLRPALSRSNLSVKN
eukprot:UN06667